LVSGKMEHFALSQQVSKNSLALIKCIISLFIS
jgi:hypothetical protein